MLALLARFATRRTSVAALAIAASLMAVGTADAQQKSNDRDFSWDGKITNGRWLYVRDLNGSIRVEKATGDRAEVTAVKRWRRGNPEDVRRAGSRSHRRARYADVRHLGHHGFRVAGAVRAPGSGVVARAADRGLNRHPEPTGEGSRSARQRALCPDERDPSADASG